MNKFLGLTCLMLITITCIYSQQNKLNIGSHYTMYDSSGTLVISRTDGGIVDFKVNGEGWIYPKYLNSTVAGVGLSLNTVLGLRFNASTGTNISNDSVVTTGEVSYVTLDSAIIGGKKLSVSDGKFDFSDSTRIIGRLYAGEVWVDGGSNLDAPLIFSVNSTSLFSGLIKVNGTSLVVLTDNPELYSVTFNDDVSFEDSVTYSSPVMNFTAGDSVKLGTTDNYDLRLKRNNEVYLTLNSSNLIVEGNTPIKFANANVFNTDVSSGTGSVLGDVPSGSDGSQDGWVYMVDNSGNIIIIPYWIYTP